MGIGATTSGRVEHRQACIVDFVGDSSGGPAAFGTHFQLGTTGPLWAIDSLDDACIEMETERYATIIEILCSYETS